MQPIYIYHSRKKDLVLMFLGGALGAASFLLSNDKWIIELEPNVVWWLFYIGTPFFAIVTTYALYKLLIRKPVFIITSDGIEDYSSLFKVGLIPWKEVDRIFYQRTSNKDFFCVALKKPKEFIKGLSRAKRFFLLRKAKNDAFLIIPQSILPFLPGKFIKEIRGSHPEVSIHYPFPIFETGTEESNISNTKSP